MVPFINDLFINEAIYKLGRPTWLVGSRTNPADQSGNHFWSVSRSVGPTDLLRARPSRDAVAKREKSPFRARESREFSRLFTKPEASYIPFWPFFGQKWLKNDQKLIKFLIKNCPNFWPFLVKKWWRFLTSKNYPNFWKFPKSDQKTVVTWRGPQIIPSK